MQIPLDEDQLQYAIGDVTYLVDCYKYLCSYMQEHHRQDWCSEELAALCDEKTYNTNPSVAWQRIRHNVHTPHFLSALKYLAEWREKRAQKYNVPKTSILKDDALLNIASSHPKTIDELRLVRNLKSEVINGRLGAEIIEVLHEAAQNPMPSDVCKLDRKSEVHIPNHEQSLMEMLKLLLKIKSQEKNNNEIPFKFINNFIIIKSYFNIFNSTKRLNNLQFSNSLSYSRKRRAKNFS